MKLKRKKVFVSYSWDGHQHQEWVLNLSIDLMKKYGIEVLLDQFELTAGKELTYFMEMSLESSDKVLIILTPKYKVKAEIREKGVGFESSIISQEIYESPISRVKYIPILRSGDSKTSSPKFLSSKIHHNMINDNLYQGKLHELARIIYGLPILEKPKLGNIPDFSKANIDPMLGLARSIASDKLLNMEIDKILFSTQGVNLFNSEISFLKSKLEEKCKFYNERTNIGLEFKSQNKTTFVSGFGFSVSLHWNLPINNSSRESYLIIKHWNGRLKLGHHTIYEKGNEPERINQLKYIMSLNVNKQPIWINNNKSVTIEEIVQSVFLYLFSEAQKNISNYH